MYIYTRVCVLLRIFCLWHILEVCSKPYIFTSIGGNSFLYGHSYLLKSQVLLAYQHLNPQKYATGPPSTQACGAQRLHCTGATDP